MEWFTNVPVKTQDGRTLRFYDDVMKGKILLINFFFTECDDVCPLATDNLVRVQELLGDRVGKDIRLVSISLQPEHDTPEVMAAYAKAHGVGPGWLFLTGQKDDIELLRHRLGFWDIDPAVDADPEQHLGTVRIANEPMHRWAMSPVAAEPGGAGPGGAPGDFRNSSEAPTTLADRRSGVGKRRSGVSLPDGLVI